MDFWDKVKKTGQEIWENGKKELGEAREQIAHMVRRVKGVNEKNPTRTLDDELHDAIDTYNATYESLNKTGEKLFDEREQAVSLIELIEELINSIAKSSKSYETDIAEIHMHKVNFKNVCEFAKEGIDITKKSAFGAGVGVSAGAAVASVAPSVAMWVATTFGTASTGVAISSLTGAAATNAALAWLGGGALAAGGGGMAAGSAFLALAGPVGWTLAGASILTSVVLFGKKKIELNEKKKEEIQSIKQNNFHLKRVIYRVDTLLNKTTSLLATLRQNYYECVSMYNSNFEDLSYEQQMQLGTLVNNTLALARSLSEKVE